ncbi:MAG: hypothetical protein VX007_08560 [Pseudomonadota bacterium]|nr:hypothetical protein [Pseudomonadota bacterium]
MPSSKVDDWWCLLVCVESGDCASLFIPSAIEFEDPTPDGNANDVE